MLDYVQICSYPRFFILFNVLYQGKERPAKTKLMPAKHRAVLACAELLILQISLRKRMFKKNHFNLFIGARIGLIYEIRK